MKLTTIQAAERLKISQRRVLKLIKDKRLPAEKFASVYVIDEKDLELVEKRKVGRPKKEKI